MKRGWLLYDDCDLAVNRDFAAFFTSSSLRHGLTIETKCLSELRFGAESSGLWMQPSPPDFVVSRQRDALISRQLEQMGVPVYNNASVCALCSDKRRTHQFLSGIVPMLRTEFSVSKSLAYPAIVKPACSHGGDRVQLVRNDAEWQAAVAAIAPHPMLQQELASDAGKDLRVYVVFGQIVAGVLRTAREGIVSNYKLGGKVELHEPTPEEQALVHRVIEAFRRADAPLCLAGVDLLYHHGEPVLSEVEDVVGSRMLYKVGGPDVVELYLDGLARHLP